MAEDQADFEDTIGRFILASPPGEEDDVYQALNTIVGAEQDISELKARYFKQHNLETYFVATIPDTNEKMLITPFGEIDDTHYVDPHGARLVTFDHTTKLITDTRPLSDEEMAGHEEMRKAIDEAVTGYVAKHFPQGVVSVFASQSEDGSNAVVVCINSTRTNPTSMWGGRWQSTWIVELGDSQAKVSGTYQVHCHFFENGNVHLKTAGNTEQTLPNKPTPAQFAQSLVQAIIKAEEAFEMSIEDSFTKLKDTSFRALRLALPRSRVKIDWETFALQGKIGTQ